MRKIRFKAKRKTDGEWLYGDLHHMNNRVYILNEDQLNSAEYYEVDPETVCQFTGLKDKDGNDIWEGDIITSENWNPTDYKIIFEEGEFCFVSLKGVEYPYTNSIHHIEHFSVTGNIHDQ